MINAIDTKYKYNNILLNVIRSFKWIKFLIEIIVRANCISLVETLIRVWNLFLEQQLLRLRTFLGLPCIKINMRNSIKTVMRLVMHLSVILKLFWLSLHHTAYRVRFLSIHTSAIMEYDLQNWKVIVWPHHLVTC